MHNPPKRANATNAPPPRRKRPLLPHSPRSGGSWAVGVIHHQLHVPVCVESAHDSRGTYIEGREKKQDPIFKGKYSRASVPSFAGKKMLRLLCVRLVFNTPRGRGCIGGGKTRDLKYAETYSETNKKSTRITQQSILKGKKRNRKERKTEKEKK